MFGKRSQYLSSDSFCSLPVHRLAACALIRSLEMDGWLNGEWCDEGVKKKVVELSVQSGVRSTFTAFVAVNKSSGMVIQGPLLWRDVPAASEWSTYTW